ncbi:hypothetical protein MNBD_GAMMA12-828 [hydrothermal vent metagenome]|uniref:Uncharacterized protein n=1 Tax=hydrothermal vent metagenome TaxID=652676 RepID=A0A3B0ZIV5_9ZZZZ
MTMDIKMKTKIKIARVVTLMLLLIANAGFADSSEWAAFQASGENAIENKNYSDAEKLFQRALSLAKENYKKTKRHAKTLYFMGQLKMLQKDPVKAIGLYEKSLKMYRRQYGKKHNKTLGVMESLAQARIDSGKPHYAEPLYRKIIAAKSKELSEKHPAVVALLAKLATLLLTLDEPKKAVPVYKKVLAIGKQTKMDKQLLARLYDEYGRALRQTGNSKDAEVAESNAIQLRSNGKEVSGFVSIDKNNSSSSANTSSNDANGNRSNASSIGVISSGTSSSGTGASTSQSSTPAKKIVKGEYKEPAGIKLFRKSMVSKKRYGVSEEYMHALCKDTRTSRGLHHCIVYWFTAPNKNIDNVYPRLTVRLFQFQDNKGALAAQQSLRKGANPNTGLNYEWNNVTVNDNWMYWVSAACTYSTSDWKALVADFKATMNVAEKQALVCRCEGGCSG